ncbi:MAG: hypothetical protein EOP88_15740 [Verrucomicrobiaceae bacterium]|nr:MAG: hypothetical protein EOP88_15740 [Verrucomicrobiaceae bacterium]
MSLFPKRHFPLLVIAVVLVAVIAVFSRRPVETPPVKTVVRKEPTALSMLATRPDWSALEIYQETISRGGFERLLTTVFTTGEAWRESIMIDDGGATIRTGDGAGDESFRLRFAAAGKEIAAAREWRTTAELPAAPEGRPLEGLRISIDAGHIGGEWAKMEERWFVLGGGKPVCEGEMTLQVANLLKPRLERLGAVVSLVRTKLEPVTPVRPEALQTLAQDSAGPEDSPAALQRLAERLFYRTAEIRARADLVNQTLKPDLVLCLHFNADAWGDPNNPTLVEKSHLHLLLNGAYNDEEVRLADQRFALLEKLLQRTHEEEVRVGSTVADTFARISGLPAYTYQVDSPNARPVPGQPYLWVRNLLANRLYDCPVIFMEPYVMNSTGDYARIQAGDYDGLREVGGKMQPSIMREYADTLAEGLAKHYSAGRVPAGE